ncbi:hypothetical protein GGD66_005895 [Bradyrhizobium sp. CIR48]|nr:hypothetical protein [Bradyrhizobium sp. CIR48]
MATAASHARATSAVMADAVAGAANVNTHANPTNLRIFLTGTLLLPRSVNACRDHSKKDRRAKPQSGAELSRGVAWASRRMAERAARAPILAVELRRLEIRKTREHCGLDELQVPDAARQFLEPALAIGDVRRKEILVMIVERLSLKVLVGTVSEGDGCARNCVIDTPVEAGLLPLRFLQCRFDRRQDGTDPRAIGLRITLRGAGLKTFVLAAGAEKIMRACSQE